MSPPAAERWPTIQGPVDGNSAGRPIPAALISSWSGGPPMVADQFYRVVLIGWTLILLILIFTKELI